MADPVEITAEEHTEGRKSQDPTTLSEGLQQSHGAAEDASGGTPARPASGSEPSSVDPVRGESKAAQHTPLLSQLHAMLNPYSKSYKP